MKSLRSLRRLIGHSPSLRFSLTQSDLLTVMSAPGVDPRVAHFSIAEALHRCWLYRNSPEDVETLKYYLHQTSRNRYGPPFSQLILFFHWLEISCQKRRSTMLPKALTGHGVWDLLRKNLSAWQRSAGAVLFVASHSDLGANQNCFATPFFFEDRKENEIVVDSQRRPWKNFEVVISKALSPRSSHSRVVFPLLDQDDVGNLQGASAGLAIAVASSHPWPQRSDSDPLPILLTGAVESGTLQGVSLGELKSKLVEKIGPKLFAYPEGSVLANPASPTETQFLPLALGPLPKLLYTLQLTLADAGIVPRLTNEVIDNTLSKIDWDLRSCRVPAKSVLRELNRLESHLEAQKKPSQKRLLKLRVYKASALCHMGESVQTKALLESSSTYAQLKKELPLFSSAIAQHIVALNDLYQFEDAKKLGESQLLKLAEEEDLDDEERLEAQMRLYGSLGQSYLGWTLNGGDYKDEALQCFTRALEAAQELSEGRDSDDVFKDLNYLALWHACFAPEKAILYFDSLESRMTDAEQFPDISFQHLRRIRLLAAYRSHIQSGVAVPKFSELPTTSGGPWVRGISCKYRGTLQAAMGEYESAYQTFHEGKELFEKEQSPLLRFFGFTLCLQAWHSLKSHDPNAAQDFYTNAETFFDNSFPLLPRAATMEWLDWKDAEWQSLPLLKSIY